MGGAVGRYRQQWGDVSERTRFSAVPWGYNVTLALFGGTAPLICTWLATRTGDLAAPAYYLIAMTLVSLAAALAWAPARTAG